MNFTPIIKAQAAITRFPDPRNAGALSPSKPFSQVLHQNHSTERAGSPTMDASDRNRPCDPPKQPPADRPGPGMLKLPAMSSWRTQR
ncbi:hypothetical protein JW905_12685 [bacterium]|nr:hypothetical protein [candidate division CSSED10-310 bacterium]